MAKQDYDAKKAAYDTDVASVIAGRRPVEPGQGANRSARGHLDQQVAQLRFNEDALSKTVSIAPFDGIVTNLPVREGETVVVGIQNAEGSTLMTIADMSVVTAEVKVDETDIVNIKIGQPAEVSVDAIPGKSFKGHVTLVGDQALLRSTGVATSQSTTGTEEAKDFKVVVTLDTPTDELRPGPLHYGQNHHRVEIERALAAYSSSDHVHATPAGKQRKRRSRVYSRPDRRHSRCRASTLSKRMRTASSAPSSSPSRLASRVQPTSKCSAVFRTGRRSSSGPTRHCEL